MLNTNCYDRVNSSIYVLTRGKCICKSMFFQESIYIERNIPSHGVKRVSRVNNKFITCVRAFVKKNVLVCCAYIQFVLLFVKRQKSVK